MRTPQGAGLCVHSYTKTGCPLCVRDEEITKLRADLAAAHDLILSGSRTIDALRTDLAAAAEREAGLRSTLSWIASEPWYYNEGDDRMVARMACAVLASTPKDLRDAVTLKPSEVRRWPRELRDHVLRLQASEALGEVAGE